jgi:hypothetical protein
VVVGAARCSVANLPDDNYSCRRGDPVERPQARRLRRRHSPRGDQCIGSDRFQGLESDFMMLVGPDTAARLVGILSAEDNDYVIHAMPARMKYINMIKTTRGDQR